MSNKLIVWAEHHSSVRFNIFFSFSAPTLKKRKGTIIVETKTTIMCLYALGSPPLPTSGHHPSRSIAGRIGVDQTSVVAVRGERCCHLRVSCLRRLRKFLVDTNGVDVGERISHFSQVLSALPKFVQNVLKIKSLFSSFWVKLNKNFS